MKTLIEISGLEKHYHGKTVLSIPKLVINERDDISLLGFSGAGKSTLLKILARTEDYDKGTILVNGKDLRAYSVKVLSSIVGMVFQDYALFANYTVIENCTLAQIQVLGKSKAEATALAMHLLDKVGMSEHLHKLPGQLSGGQKQRVAIARTLTMNPSIILLDEPLSGLDPTNRKKFSELTKTIKAYGTTIIMVSHEVEYARKNSTRCIFMSAGKIIEDSQVQEFFNETASDEKANYLECLTY